MMQTDELQTDGIACRSVAADLLQIVADSYELKPEDVWAKHRGLSEARAMFAWLAREDPRMRLSTNKLAKLLGRDHTTLISAYKRHVREMAKDAWLRKRSEELLARVLEKSRGNQE